MRSFAFTSLAAVASALSCAAEAQVIPIHLGEALTIRFVDGWATVIERASAPPLTPYETGLLHRLQAQTQQIPKGATAVAPEPIYPDMFPGAPPPSVDGEVHIAFRRVPSLDASKPGDSLLVLTDGYKQSFRYRAVMHGKERSAATDVCEVLPGKSGTEYWPYVIEWLELSDLRLEPSTEGAIRCQ
jgi:hypothetical protein